MPDAPTPPDDVRRRFNEGDHMHDPTLTPLDDSHVLVEPGRVRIPGLEPLPAQIRAAMRADQALTDLLHRHIAKEQAGMVDAMIRTNYRIAARRKNLKHRPVSKHVRGIRNARTRSAYLEGAA